MRLPRIGRPSACTTTRFIGITSLWDSRNWAGKQKQREKFGRFCGTYPTGSCSWKTRVLRFENWNRSSSEAAPLPFKEWKMTKQRLRLILNWGLILGVVARDYLALVAGSKDPKVFSTDDAKALSSDYNPPGAPEQDALAAGCRMNLAVHNTANAVAKRAFLMRLDKIAAARRAKKRVVVTDGGVGAGKIYAIENNSHACQLMMDADAVCRA